MTSSSQKKSSFFSQWAFLLFGLAALSLIFLLSFQSLLDSSKNGDNLDRGIIPDFHLESVQGKSFDLSESPAPLTVLHFWARWCGVCMKEMPALVEFVGEYQKKGVQVFGISVDERPEIMIPKTVVEFGLNFPNFADKGGKIAQFFQLHGVPLTVFYNKNRKILAVQPGDIDWLSVKMQKRIEQWISDPQNQ